jgi:hypothetical protein
LHRKTERYILSVKKLANFERSLDEMLDSVPLVVVLSVSGLLVIAVMVALTIAVFARLWR